MKRVVVAAAVSMATLLLALLLWKFRVAAALFVASLAVAAMLRPLVRALEPRLGRALALAITYMASLGLLGVFFYVVTHGFLHELDEGLERLGAAYDRVRKHGSSSPLYAFILQRLPPASALYQAVGGRRPMVLLDSLLGVTLNAIDVTGRFIVVVALSAYWSASREGFERLWLSLLPASSRTRAREIWQSVERAVGAHMRSELARSLICVLFLGLVFRVGALPTPMLPAVAAGVFRLVPFVGNVIAAAAAFLAGLVVSPAVGAAAALSTLLVLLLLDRGISGRFFSARRYSATLTVFLIVGLVDAYGLLGLLIASPLAAAVQVFIERLIATHPAKIARARSLGDIQRRIARARQRLLSMPMPPEQATQLGSVVARLGALAVEARSATEPGERASPSA